MLIGQPPVSDIKEMFYVQCLRSTFLSPKVPIFKEGQFPHSIQDVVVLCENEIELLLEKYLTLLK